jgi:hypothetical protein
MAVRWHQFLRATSEALAWRNAWERLDAGNGAECCVRVAGPGWWLWVFTTLQLTFYVVAQSRGRCFLSDILGENFHGVLVSDCLATFLDHDDRRF